MLQVLVARIDNRIQERVFLALLQDGEPTVEDGLGLNRVGTELTKNFHGLVGKTASRTRVQILREIGAILGREPISLAATTAVSVPDLVMVRTANEAFLSLVADYQQIVVSENITEDGGIEMGTPVFLGYTVVKGGNLVLSVVGNQGIRKD